MEMTDLAGLNPQYGIMGLLVVGVVIPFAKDWMAGRKRKKIKRVRPDDPAAKTIPERVAALEAAITAMKNQLEQRK